MNAWIIGIHLLTAHVGQIEPGLELRHVTPGIYAMAPSGLTFGAYKNSVGKDTVYLGYTYDSKMNILFMKNIMLTGAVATGYPNFKDVGMGVRVGPLAAISFKLNQSEYAPRVMWIPHKTSPINFSIEKRF